MKTNFYVFSIYTNLFTNPPKIESYITWADVKRDNKMKRFYLPSTFKAGGAYLARCYRKHWLIESFFKSIKYDFGLKEARRRTKVGIKLWIFFACLAYSQAKLEQALATQAQTLSHAAKAVSLSLIDVHFIHLLSELHDFNYRHSQHLKLVSALMQVLSKSQLSTLEPR